MPFTSSIATHVHMRPTADRARRRTGPSTHHVPKLTSATLISRKPRCRSADTRPDTKRAGGKPSYSRNVYSSIECAACAITSPAKARWTREIDASAAAVTSGSSRGALVARRIRVAESRTTRRRGHGDPDRPPDPDGERPRAKRRLLHARRRLRAGAAAAAVLRR